MSWQLAAFAILAFGLASGFAWYERGRPDARIVALVGTLAAFAALGRIAFAAVPNVKPTTDIVLVAGYALGGAPGFVVGALAGLTSNFFFGQGPWTPWQMAAWGAIGLLGAALASITGRRLRRVSLAAVCGAAGFAFTVAQDVGDWVTYSDHSVAQLGVYVGKGIGFDTVHALGCVVFALALGPALIRSISRFALRLQVTWRTPGSETVVAIALLVALTGGSGLLEAPAAQAASSPTSYLLGAQNQDGGLGGAPGEGSSPLYSGWAALGLAAAGHDPARVSRGGASLIDYIRAGVGPRLDAGSLERTILVVGAAGLSPAAFGGEDLIAALERAVQRDGSVSDQVNLTSFAVLAFRAAGVSPPPAMVPWLARQRDRDGGFNFATAGETSDVDDSGAALEALAGSELADAVRARGSAIAFIRAQQNQDGGFPSQPGGTSNAQSTAWAVQGMVAAGVNPDSLHHFGASPLQYLSSLVGADGHVRYEAGSDQTPVWVTAEALMALARRPLPFAPVVAAGSPAPRPGAGAGARGVAGAQPSHGSRHRHTAAGGRATQARLPIGAPNRDAATWRTAAAVRQPSGGGPGWLIDVAFAVVLVLATELWRRRRGRRGQRDQANAPGVASGSTTPEA
jgi:energy-coupling factor transport system substrate-specific component